MTKTPAPEQIDETALDAISGGPIEVRELTIKTTVDESETIAHRDMILKGKKILQN